MSKQLAICIVCQTPFWFYPVQGVGRFCSRACYWAQMRGRPTFFDVTGHTPWNKGKTGVYTDQQRTSMGASNKGRKHTEEEKRKISKAGLGNKNSLGSTRVWSAESNKKRSAALTGRPCPYNRGPNSTAWKGGVSAKNDTARQLIMKSLEYKNWRRKVFERDNFTCQMCGATGVYLQADHIKPMHVIPELTLVINNGQSLCVPCHKAKTRRDYAIYQPSSSRSTLRTVG